MTRRHLRNIERTDAQRVRKVTFNLVARWKSREEEPLAPWELELLDSMRDLDRRDYVWPDSAETPTSGTETGQDGDEGVGSVSVEGGRDFDCCAARDRDIAEAVAHEREAIARRVESTGRAVLQAGLGAGEDVWRDCHVRGLELIDAARDIRAGAHHKGADW